MVIPHDSRMDDPSNNPPCSDDSQDIEKEVKGLTERNTEEVRHDPERGPSGKSVNVIRRNGSNDVTEARNDETNGSNRKMIGIKTNKNNETNGSNSETNRSYSETTETAKQRNGINRRRKNLVSADIKRGSIRYFTPTDALMTGLAQKEL